MKVVVTPDNEIEVWEGNQKLGYVDNNALFVITNNRAEYAGDLHDRNDILPAVKNFLRKKKEEAYDPE